MTNYSHGHEAEQKAAQYLQTEGFKIVALNWRTRVCEIDIVARKNRIIHFVEVKYRKSTQQGTGLDYITPKKLAQMQFAAECWVQENNYKGDYELSAIELTGLDFRVINFLPSIL